MSTENLIKEYYQAFNDKDMSKFFGLLDEGIVHDINQGERQIGLAAFKNFMVQMNKCYEENITDLAVFASVDGGRAAAEFTVNGKYLKQDEGLPPASGQTYTLPAGAFFEINNRLITRITNYYNLQDWLAQICA